MLKVHKPTKRVIDILLNISKYQEGLNFTEISKLTEIPKSTLSPILKTLVDEKMLYLNEYTMKYKVGSRSFKIGYSFVDNLDIMAEIRQKMQIVVDECDEICQLGILDDKNVLYIAKVEPLQAIKLESSVGKSLPAHVTALGKCLLTNFSDAEIKSMYKDGMEKYTKNTITDIDVFLKEIGNVRKLGIAYEWGEANEQVMCLAVPINNNHKAILSISVSVPIYRADKVKLKKIEQILKKIQASIEKNIKILGVSGLSKI